MEQITKKVLILVLLVALAAVSFFYIGNRVTQPETHRITAESIDDKISTVLKLTATSTVASAGMSAIPGDTATPIANKLADFSEYFLLILCVLYAEKYLLTIIGAGAFKILIPIACAAAGIGLFWNGRTMGRLGMRFAAVALAVYFVIPMSIHVSDMIYDVYQSSIDSTIASAEELSDDTAALAEASEDQGLISSILSRISESAESLTERAADILNRFVETLAVMIVTSCIIPLLVLLFFLWIVKLLTGIEITPPRPHHKRGMEA